MLEESEPAAASPFPVLIVDDDPVQCRLLEAYVLRMGGRPTSVLGVAQALRLLDGRDAAFQVMILDLMMPDGSGFEVLAHLKSRGAAIPVIVQTSKAGLDTVVAAMRAGAFDFIVKPASPDKIRLAIEAALRLTKPVDVEVFASVPATLSSEATPMGMALAAAAKAARSTIPVLLLGETGVGKEWLARRIVEAGPRARGPFVAVNCGALPRDLVESILFGHERGAFTGAAQRYPGKFMEADGGTLFLDEVGELSPDTQVKLLRALQEGEIDPVGAPSPVRTDVRIVAATHRDLEADVRSGRFREDLFYRLCVFPILVPPLRDRRDEIGGLAESFARRFDGTAQKRLSDEALRLLERQDWPGNIRQLENAVHRAVVLSDGPVLGVAAFGEFRPAQMISPLGFATQSASSEKDEQICDGVPRPGMTQPPGFFQASYSTRFLKTEGDVVTLREMERALIVYALDHYQGRLSTVARRLGIGRSTLYRKLREYGLDHAD